MKPPHDIVPILITPGALNLAASAALEMLVKKNRHGRGLTGSSTYIVRRYADQHPMTLDEFTRAVAKLIPLPGPGEPA